MNINLLLFSERFKRVLAGEEGLLRDSTKPCFQNILSEVETITALLRNYEGDMTWILIQLLTEEDVNRPDPSVTLPLNLRKPLTHSLSASCNKIVKVAVLLMTCAMLLKDYKVKSLILQIGCSKFHLTRKILVSVKKGTSAFRLVNTGKASTSSSVETEAEFVIRKKAGLRWLWWISTTQDFAPEINVLGRRVDNEGRSHAITRKVIYQLEKAS